MLKFLGRGSAFNIREGNTAAYIKEGGKLFLIDCGSNIFVKMMLNGFLEDVLEVHVAITHRHPDHIGSLGDLILYCYHKKNIRLNIYSEDEQMQNYLLMIGILQDQYIHHRNGYIESLGIRICFQPCRHAAIYKEPNGILSNNPSEHSNNIFPCYSIILEYKDKKIFYSGDTNHVAWDQIENFDAYYVDTTISDYPGNAHYNVDQMYKDCIACDITLPTRIWCMHLNSNAAIQRAVVLGFHIVSIE